MLNKSKALNTHPQNFQLKRDRLFFFMMVIFPFASLFLPLPFVFLGSDPPQVNELITFVIIYAVVLVFLYFISIKSYYDSIYTITGNQLICKMGIYKKRVDIDRISLIAFDGYPMGGYRLALSFKGLKLIYGAGHIVYISPENHDGFIEKLQSINPKIKVVKK